MTGDAQGIRCHSNSDSLASWPSRPRQPASPNSPADLGQLGHLASVTSPARRRRPRQLPSAILPPGRAPCGNVQLPSAFDAGGDV